MASQVETTDPRAAPPKDVVGRPRTPIYVAAAFIALATILVHLGSYWWSPSLTLWDVGVTCEEGLIAFDLPLTRLTATGKPASNFLIYKRDQLVWTAGLAGKSPLRSWMASLDSVRCSGGMFADFGFWKGAWKSEARPGPFIVVFTPVWLAGVAIFGGFLAIYYRLLRFRLRTVFIATALCGCVFWLLTLRAPAN